MIRLFSFLSTDDTFEVKKTNSTFEVKKTDNTFEVKKTDDTFDNKKPSVRFLPEEPRSVLLTNSSQKFVPNITGFSEGYATASFMSSTNLQSHVVVSFNDFFFIAKLLKNSKMFRIGDSKKKKWILDFYHIRLSLFE